MINILDFKDLDNRLKLLEEFERGVKSGEICICSTSVKMSS